MISIKVSRRYGQLFSLKVIERDVYGENVIFPQGNIPLIFKTDDSARTVAKIHIESVSFEQFNLFVGGCYICSSSKDTIDAILSFWVKQGVNLPNIVVIEKSSGEDIGLQHSAESEANLIDIIINQCI